MRGNCCTLLKALLLVFALGAIGCSTNEVLPIEIETAEHTTNHVSYPCGPYWNPYVPGFRGSFVAWTPDGSQILFKYRFIRSDPNPHTATVILMVDAAGTRLHKLVEVGSGFIMLYGSHADLSPDGQRIVHTTCALSTNPSVGSSRELERARFHYEIAMINLDGTGQQRLTENKYLDHYPVWSPDGNRIAFISSRRSISGATELYTMAPDGSDVHVIASTLLKGFTSDGREIWRTSAESTRLGIDRGEETGSLESAWLGGLTFVPPVWSPDEEHIAFLVDEGKYLPYHKVLFTVRVDGLEMTRIAGNADTLWPSYQETSQSPDTTLVVLPAWSPDGEYLAFVMADEKGKPGGVYTVRPDGTELQQVLEPQAENWSPVHLAWSPDGMELLVLTKDHGLYAVRTGGSSLSHVAFPNSAMAWAAAAWSPDGARIALYVPGNPYENIPPQLYTVARDGTDLRTLVRADADGNLVPANPPEDE